MINEEKARKEVKQLEKDLIILILSHLTALSTDANGVPVFNSGNISLASINGIMRKFNKKFQIPFLKSIFKEIKADQKLSQTYFVGLGLDSETKGFISKDIKKLNKGLIDYLDKFSTLTPIQLAVRSSIVGGVSSGASLSKISRDIKDTVTGSMERYYNTFMWESVAEHERISNLFYADAMELEFFVYEGGLIETSRHFCVKRNQKVFHRSEANKWRFDPSLPSPETADTYQPLIELGRWNCRHFLRWITEDEAIKLGYEKKTSNYGV